MKILICDDDRHMAKSIASQISDFYRHKGIRTDITVEYDPEKVIQREDLALFDAAFLDAQMEPLDGIEVGRIIKKVRPSVILVYISAFLEFAPQGYTVDTFRYLLKSDLNNSLPICLNEIVEEIFSSKAMFTFKTHGESMSIPYEEIYFFESDLRKINIYGAEAYKIIESFYGKISDLEPIVNNDCFLKVSTRDIVNMAHIRSISNYEVTLTNQVVIGASRKSYPQVKEKFIEWKGSI